MEIKTGNRLCCVYNAAPHYRSLIFNLIDKQIGADVYIGDRGGAKLKPMDYSELNGFCGTLKSKIIWKTYYWQIGVQRILLKPYSKFLFDGELNCISTWAALFLAKLYKKKIYLWTHGYYGNEGLIKRILKKVYFGLSTGVFLYGVYARDIMLEQGHKPQKLHLIYNSLDYDDQLALRGKLEDKDVFNRLFENNYPVAVYIGRIQERKRLDLLIKAIANLKSKEVGVNLLLIGESDSSLNLDKLAKSLGVDKNICFYGPCYDEKIIGSLIFNADVCVSPGNVGLTAMHVLAYGTPILTSDNFYVQRPEFEAIKKGVTGDFFKDNSVEDLEDKLLNWINLSPEKREESRQEAYRVIDEKYNPHRQIETFLEVLNS